MEIRFFPPHPLLAPYVAHLWTVESETAFLPGDLKAILPNGRMKLVFPYKGALFNGPAGRAYETNAENSLWVLGMADKPWVVDHDGAFGTLAVEFHPGAAYKFFALPLRVLQNQVVPAPEVFGIRARDWESQLAEEATPAGKAARLQRLLLELLGNERASDSLVDHAVALIRSRKGLITIGELTQKMGYSQRYLALKFEARVGVGPKTLAEILRFQNQFAFLTRLGGPPGRLDFDDGYYDQAHFTKEFKRFAGLPPAQYSRARNEFFNLFQQTSDSYKTG